MEENLKTIIEQFVDYLLPELTPYESSLYLYLFRNSFIKNGTVELRIGKRTIANTYGRGSKGKKVNYEHISKILRYLEGKGCIKVGNTTREVTLYTIKLPSDISIVIEKLTELPSKGGDEDYFTDPEKRSKIFERDKWVCQYCGEKVSSEDATLDHFIPQSNSGKHTKENLKTSCLICNSIKSGKTYDEAAPFLLRNIQERKSRSHT